jgi:hypothetical protein
MSPAHAGLFCLADEPRLQLLLPEMLSETGNGSKTGGRFHAPGAGDFLEAILRENIPRFLRRCSRVRNGLNV